MMGYDFHRQKPLDQYIVDLFCNRLRLVIEIDGNIHNSEDQKFKDFKRQEAIEDYGVCFLRFTNCEVMEHLDMLLKTIANWIMIHEEAGK
jgi:very-short-patch-repair endonuclease